MQASWSWAPAALYSAALLLLLLLLLLMLLLLLLLLRGMHATPFRGLPSEGCFGPTSCHLKTADYPDQLANCSPVILHIRLQ